MVKKSDEQELKDLIDQIGIPTRPTPVPSEVFTELQDKRKKEKKVKRKEEFLKPVALYFQEDFVTSEELSMDLKLRDLIFLLLKVVRKNIRNKFTFYLFLSPFDVEWNLPETGNMSKPPKSNFFFRTLSPSQQHQKVVDILDEVKWRGWATMNFYVFVKELDAPDDGKCSAGGETWSLEEL